MLALSIASITSYGGDSEQEEQHIGGERQKKGAKKEKIAETKRAVTRATVSMATGKYKTRQNVEEGQYEILQPPRRS